MKGADKNESYQTNKIRFDFFPPSSLNNMLYGKTVCLIGTALGKYVIVMCLDFKEHDTSLHCPVTFGFL